MSWIDFVLNIAGVLLWLNWRSQRLDAAKRAAPASLAGTLKPAGHDPLKGWRLPGALALLLLGKAFIYWQFNSSAEWPPRLELGVIVLAFRVGSFPLALLFSAASLVRMLLIVYMWLLVLLALGRGAAEPDPVQRVIALQFGRLSRWPWWVLPLLPSAAVVLLWLGLHPLLLLAGAVDPVKTVWVLLWQGLLLGGAIFLSLKYLLPVILLLHLVSCYVYLGKHPAWDFVSTTSRTLLRPIQGLRLRSAKMDFTPLAGMILSLLVLHALPGLLMAWATRHNVAIWPQ